MSDEDIRTPDTGSPWTSGVGMALAWITLAATLALTLFGWHQARQHAAGEAQARFDFRVSEIRLAVEARMQAQARVLYGARAFHYASTEVTREEWRRYVESLDLPTNYSGILGLGFALRLRPEEVAAHERQVRAEGFPNYAVRPPGPREEYTSILYLEPFDVRNQRAFGFDMFSEPVRRAAMAASRDTGRPHITGKIVLVQENGHDIQPGVMMYLPVYRPGMPLASADDRREALRGYVYSPFRTVDLMRGILGTKLPDVRLDIYDGGEALPEALIYSSHPEFDPSAAAHGDSAPPPAEGAYASIFAIELYGRQWTLRVTSLPAFDASVPAKEQRLVLIGGLVISALLFAIVLSLATLRTRAVALARQMTAALRESREQFRAVSETAADAIVTAREDGSIVYFNRAAERIFGHPAAEAVGQPVTLLIPERFRVGHKAGWDRYMHHEHFPRPSQAAEMVGLRRDGSEFPIEISVAGWSTGRGRFCTAILRDITERRRTESHIQELNSRLQTQVEQLAEVNQELESFSYSVSHDLRTPLRAIDGFAGMLDEDYGRTLDAEGQRLLGIIRQNSRRMGQLIDDLLSFSRLGRTSAHRAPVDMAGLAQEVVDELRTVHGADGVRFDLAPLPAALGDASLLRQVWVNLLGNAVKFSRTQPEPRIEIGWEQEGTSGGGGLCIYFVQDNGVGFDMAQAARLFGVFQRLHRQEDFPGTGVGLAIVHRIVTKHGGRIWAESRAGSGAVFRFSLPRPETGPPSTEAGDHGRS